ncbi:hypothetical protein [Sphingomonas sp.]|uniref:hypothetical protein n=1 Tax=Sphingomonas sp. TaxID=28214 RepID=UPI0025D88B80|nr:hypothetical protein [Sphingomonas sp.]
MTTRAQRWAWTAVMALLPFAVVAFGRLNLDVTQWSAEARIMTAFISAVCGVAAATFPYRESRA